MYVMKRIYLIIQFGKVLQRIRLIPHPMLMFPIRKQVKAILHLILRKGQTSHLIQRQKQRKMTMAEEILTEQGLKPSEMTTEAVKKEILMRTASYVQFAVPIKMVIIRGRHLMKMGLRELKANIIKTAVAKRNAIMPTASWRWNRKKIKMALFSAPVLSMKMAICSLISKKMLRVTTISVFSTKMAKLKKTRIIKMTLKYTIKDLMRTAI